VLRYLHVGVELEIASLRRLDLRHADAVGRVQDLALQVRSRRRQSSSIKPSVPDPGRGQVQLGRRPEAAAPRHSTFER
jgi:hypothetical protein